MRKTSILPVVLALALVLSACAPDRRTEFPTEPVAPSEATADPTPVTADVSAMDFTFTDRELSGDYENALALTPDNCRITTGGTYIISGSITDRAVTVAAGENDKVQLVLDDAHIRNSAGPAILIQSADKVFLTLRGENVLSDGSAYQLDDTAVDGAVFSRADLAINGSGSLVVEGNYKHGIVSKDDLVVTAAALTVTAKNVGLSGKDCVKLSDGTALTVTAGSDGIRSDNAEDADRGYVYIQGGDLRIDAGHDGIQAQTVLRIDGGQIAVRAGDGSDSGLTASQESCKGLKAGSDILLGGGEYAVNSQDDCIHSNGTISIAAGSYTLCSGDDGLHADTDLAVSGGDLTVLKSYEGLEGSRILISGGRLDITAADDGLNAAGGNDASAMGGRPGMGGFDNGVGEILISGGYTLIDASGDGVDSNGTIAVSGGVTLVSGPTNGGNGALDYGRSAFVTGGVFIAVGSVGMDLGLSQAENQGAILCTVNGQSGQALALCDENGRAVVAYTPKKAYQSVVISAPGIQTGSTYTVVTGGEAAGVDENGYAENTTLTGGNVQATVEMTSSLYSAGGMGGMGGRPGGFGGGGGRPGGLGGGMMRP